MSHEDPSWDDADPAATGQRRRTIRMEARATDETGVPDALRQPPDGARSASSPAPTDGLDFEDVGPTSISAELPSGEQVLDDVPMYQPLRDGDVLADRYRIERILGRGATGLVYEATDSVEERPVAVKVLFPHVAVQPTAVRRLFREARIAARVQHPNVVQVFEGARADDTYYLAMELLEGQPLSEHLEAHGPLPLADVQALFDQVLSGVAAVHDEGVVHRDLKPDNIYLCMRRDDPLAFGIPKVLDFGISKVKAGVSPSTKLTAMGTVMGTPYYMAPEQLADTSSVGVRADVYSLGVVLFETLTGVLPYRGESVVEIFTAASEGRMRPLAELRSDCPEPVQRVVRRAMSPDESDRYEDVHAMRVALLDAFAAAQTDALSESGLIRAGSVDPIPVAPTKAMATGYTPGAAQPTPLTSPTVEMKRPEPESPIAGLTPTKLVVMLAVAAAAGGIFVALFAVMLYFILG